MTNYEIKTVRSIKEQYEAHTPTKLDELKELDKKVKRPANIFSYVFGSVGSLVLGGGMCLAMGVIESIGTLMAPGIIIGAAGIAMVSANYFIHKAMIKSRKQKYSEQILALSDSIMGNN